jgi:hypothetical protein
MRHRRVGDRRSTTALRRTLTWSRCRGGAEPGTRPFAATIGGDVDLGTLAAGNDGLPQCRRRCREASCRIAATAVQWYGDPAVLPRTIRAVDRGVVDESKVAVPRTLTWPCCRGGTEPSTRPFAAARGGDIDPGTLALRVASRRIAVTNIHGLLPHQGSRGASANYLCH